MPDQAALLSCYVHHALDGKTCVCERKAGYEHTICTNGLEHRWCEGSDTTPTESYTPALAKTVHSAWRIGLSKPPHQKFFQDFATLPGKTKEVNFFGIS